MVSSKEVSRRQFFKGVAAYSTVVPDCFLGRDSRELAFDVFFTITAGVTGAAATGILISPESEEITRKKLFLIAGGGSVGAAIGLATGELLRRDKRRRIVEEYLNSLPLPPEGNIEISELSLSELVEMINHLEGKTPSLEEEDILLTATAYQAAQFLGEPPARAREYARRLFKVFEEEEFAVICQEKIGEDRAGCVTIFSGGKPFAFFDSSEKEWEQLSDTGTPIRSWVRVIAHEVAHMNIRQLEVFPQTCGRPKEDYGFLGELEIFGRKGFVREFVEPKTDEQILDRLLEEEFFAEWVAMRFLNELEKAGLEKVDSEPMSYPEFLQAIVHLELPDSNWPEWWKGALDFDRVAKLHWENNLWRFHRDIGEVMLSYMHPFLNFGEGDKAALGRLAFEAFSKTDMEKFECLVGIESAKDMENL